MYTFIAVAGLAPGRSTAAVLEQAGSRLSGALEAVGPQLVCNVTECHSISGGWVLLRPRDAPAPSTPRALLAEHIEPDLMCLIHGQLDCQRPSDLLAVFRSGGADAVSRMGGMFSAIVVDRRAGQLVVVCSTLGCHSVNFAEHDELLVVSPLIAGISCIAPAPPELDHEAIATAVATGWSLGGKLPVQGVECCDPFVQVHWAARNVRRVRQTPLIAGARLDPRDTDGIARQRDHVIELLQDGVRRAVSTQCDPPIRAALTAGMDSRAVVALLSSVAPKDALEVYTRGAASDRDVQVAQQLAERFGIRHVHVPDTQQAGDDFLRVTSYRALLTDGTYAATAAVGSSVTPGSRAFSGAGAEMYRGSYYPYVRRLPGQDSLEAVYRAQLRFKLSGIEQLPFASPHFRTAARSQLRDTVASLARVSADAFDLSDLFFIYERFSRWASWSWRISSKPSLVPFADSTALQNAFVLPAPVGDSALVEAIVKRFAPRSVYWTPVNGRELLAFQGPGTLRYGVRELARVLGKLRTRIVHQLRPRAASAAPLRLDEQHPDVLRSLLLPEHSVARELFSRDELERACRGASVLNRSSALGVLVSFELWAAQLRQLGQHSNRPG